MKNTLSLTQYGPWALVTGASSGIGEQFAHHLAKQGLNLILVARRIDRLAELKDELSVTGVEVEILSEDLGSAEAIDRILQTVAGRDVGLVVSNAGFGLKGGLTSHSREQLESMLNVNARAPLMLLHGILPQLLQRPAAGIILTGSQEGEAPYPWSTAYAASKAFVHSLGLGLYGELQNTGVDLLVLAPGATDTEALSLQGFDAKALPGLMTPAAVSLLALQHLGHTALYTPGFMNRLFSWVFRVLPKRWTIAITGKAMAAALEQAGQPVSKS